MGPWRLGKRLWLLMLLGLFTLCAGAMHQRPALAQTANIIPINRQIGTTGQWVLNISQIELYPDSSFQIDIVSYNTGNTPADAGCGAAGRDTDDYIDSASGTRLYATSTFCTGMYGAVVMVPGGSSNVRWLKFPPLPSADACSPFQLTWENRWHVGNLSLPCTPLQPTAGPPPTPIPPGGGGLQALQSVLTPNTFNRLLTVVSAAHNTVLCAADLAELYQFGYASSSTGDDCGSGALSDICDILTPVIDVSGVCTL